MSAYSKVDKVMCGIMTMLWAGSAWALWFAIGEDKKQQREI